MDLKSMLGYADNSPYRNAAYLDIKTPEGLITMANTSIDLLGIDNMGNVKKMKAGRKNPYKFKGDTVREIPMAQQGGLAPLYTQNPNDPRLRAYQDSLAARKNTDDMLQAFKMNGWENHPITYTSQANYKKNLNDKADMSDFTYNGISADVGIRTNPSGTRQGFPVYKKPVQPVIYQKPQSKPTYQDSLTAYNLTSKYRQGVKSGDITGMADILKDLERKGLDYNRIEPLTHEQVPVPGKVNTVIPVPMYKKPVGTPKPKRRTSSAQLLPDEMDNMNLQVQGRTSPNVDVNKEIKTNYSYSYRNPEGGQSTRYFPDLGSWQDYMKDKTYVTQRVSGDKSEAQATGYQKMGGRNPYQQGGNVSAKQAFDFLFSGDDEEETKTQVPTAPSTEEVEEQSQAPVPDDQYEMAMQIAGNPYAQRSAHSSGNPYTGQVISSGQQGAQGIGEQGRQIYGQLANDLGYAPVANSIYRTQAQQNDLISKGLGVKNSYHLTGDAIDLKPDDWHRLSNEQQQYYRMSYDVVYHNNHYHIEPK